MRLAQPLARVPAAFAAARRSLIRTGVGRAPWCVVAASALAGVLVLLSARDARANAPEFVAALTGKAADQWQADCANATITGTACSTNICGANITIDPGGSPTSRNLVIDGKTYNLHDVTTNRVDLAAAALLNALCSAGTGDPFVAGAGSFAVQNRQIESFMARARVTSIARGDSADGAAPGAESGAAAGGEVAVGMVPVSVLSVGGAYERGSHSSNGFLIPVAYARNLSATQFMGVNADFLYGTRGGGGTQADGRTVPGLHELGFSLTPSYGMEMRKGKSTYALGGYLPVAWSKASVADTDQSFTAYALGLGGIGTLTTLRGRTVLNAGLAFSGRKTGGAFSLPVTALARAQHPLSAALEGYGSLSYGNDPVGAKTGLLTIAAGVAAGKTEFGVRGFVGSDYNAVLLGFTYTQELEGSFAIERPAEEGAKTAEPPTEPAEKPAEKK